MARAKTKADEVYNARRRYRRQAQRFLDRAKRTKNPERRAELKAQAKEAIENAVSTYSGSKTFGRIAEIAKTLNVSSDLVKPQSSLDHLITKSFDIKLRKEANQRNEMAMSILSNENVASRFYAGFVDIWDTPQGKKNINKTIIEYFGARDLLEVIEMLQDSGIDIYSPQVNEQNYDAIVLKVQQLALQYKYGKQ